VDWLLLILLVLAALATVATARLLRSAIGLAVTSVVLSVLMFRLNAPIAGVFELSVCAGLIPVIFISAIGLTRRLGPDQLAMRRKEKLRQYAPLPLIVALAAVALWQVHMPLVPAVPAAGSEQDVRNVMWNMRHIDLLGQIGILAAGAFGVVVLVKGARHDN
jgi:NADH-quinone oxidoreductase subunit J